MPGVGIAMAFESLLSGGKTGVNGASSVSSLVGVASFTSNQVGVAGGDGFSGEPLGVTRGRVLPSQSVGVAGVRARSWVGGNG